MTRREHMLCLCLLVALVIVTVALAARQSVDFRRRSQRIRDHQRDIENRLREKAEQRPD